MWTKTVAISKKYSIQCFLKNKYEKKSINIHGGACGATFIVVANGHGDPN